MTDETPRRTSTPEQETNPLDEGAKDTGARRAPRRQSIATGRVAAAGVGIAAMIGLVANMEVGAGRAEAAKLVRPPAPAPYRSIDAAHLGMVLRKVAAAKANGPIVLTPHAIVNTVSAPSSGGGGSYSAGGSYSGGGSYSAAPARAAAPVASSGGSH